MTHPLVAARLAGDIDFKDATAGKPDCYGESVGSDPTV
jgi:hypothetical protein